MGKVVTVMNMKGGVGKTTVAMHLAGCVAFYSHTGHEKIKRVLVIDYDPQFNLSQAFLPSKVYFNLETQRKTTLAILADDPVDIDPYHLQVPGNHNPPKLSAIRTELSNLANGKCLHILPSTLDLMYVALGQASTQLKPMEERFKKFIAECRDEYDLVLIDCHPAGSIFTKTSIQNSDAVLIPVVPQRYAARGIGLMLKFLDAKSYGGHAPKPIVLFNKTSRTSVSSIENNIRANIAYAPLCMTATLKSYKAFAEPEEGKGFVWRSSAPYSTEAFRNLLTVTREFLGRIV